MAHWCQSKKIKITKIKKIMMKNENKKVEKIKEKLFRKAPHTNYYGPWVPKLIKMFFIQKEKNTQNNHGPWNNTQKKYTKKNKYTK